MIARIQFDSPLSKNHCADIVINCNDEEKEERRKSQEKEKEKRIKVEKKKKKRLARPRKDYGNKRHHEAK